LGAGATFYFQIPIKARDRHYGNHRKSQNNLLDRG
jgi:hypothetical protein